MGFVSAKDGTQIFYKDWGSGQPVVFSHGWPLCADAWDNQMMFLGGKGFRVIAHDRRGHGRSQQTWTGNHMDTYADDLAALMDHLDIKNAIMVGHSTGGGEVTRYLGRHGTKRVAKGGPVGSRAAADAENRRQSQRHTQGSLRRHPRRHAGRPLAILQGSDDAVLRVQPRRGRGIARHSRRVLVEGMMGGIKRSTIGRAVSETIPGD